MYRPQAYVQDDVAILHSIVRERSFATLSIVEDGEVRFAYAPVVLDASAGAKGGVRFHLARANPMAELNGAKVRFTFLGPDAYISPDWYATEGLVPTWNYIAVEASGTARRQDNAALRQLLVDLSSQHEERLRPKAPWSLDKMPERKLAALLEAIVGFSVCFETLEGKFKLSQDKKSEDFEGVVTALDSTGEPSAQSVAMAMRNYGRPKA